MLLLLSSGEKRLKKNKHKLHHAAHIKPGTQGAYNELSFDVLDKMKHSASEDDKNSSVFSKNQTKHSSPEYTPTELPVTSTLSLAQKNLNDGVYQKEVQKRKSERTRTNRKTLLISIICIFAVVVCAVGGVVTYRHHISNISDVNQFLSQIIKQGRAIDENIDILDGLLRKEIDDTAISDFEDLEERLKKDTETLGKLSAKLSENEKQLVEFNKAAYSSVSLSVQSKQELISSGIAIFKETADSYLAGEKLIEGLKLVLEGDALMKQGAEAAGMGHEQIDSSLDYSNQALVKLGDARTCLQQAATIYPFEDIDKWLEYIEKKIEACSFAISADEALMQRDTDLAMEHNENYEEADSAAAELAENLNKLVLDDLYASAANAITGEKERYNNARESMLTADSNINENLKLN